MRDALEQAIEACDGATNLAAAIGASVQRLSNWRSRGVPAEFCPRIERVTRGLGRPVLCEALRPDIEWSVLRQPDSAGPARRKRAPKD